MAAAQNPRASIERALREFHEAEPKSDLLGLRDAAEKGWLAVAQATDRFIKNNTGLVIEPGPDASERRVEALVDAGRYDILQQYRNLRDGLHSMCFYGGRCPVRVLVVDLEHAQQYVDTVGGI